MKINRHGRAKVLTQQEIQLIFSDDLDKDRDACGELRLPRISHQCSKPVLVQGSRGAGEQGSRGAREQGSRGAGEQGSKGAGEQGSRGEFNVPCSFP
ncbi:MAG: hypothetical protein V7L23_21490, partial [Nostoc sp.]